MQTLHPRLLHRLVLAQPLEVVAPELYLPLLLRKEQTRPLDESLLAQLPHPSVLPPQLLEWPVMAVEELKEERQTPKVLLPLPQQTPVLLPDEQHRL